jgi:hypothetical protein
MENFVLAVLVHPGKIMQTEQGIELKTITINALFYKFGILCKIFLDKFLVFFYLTAGKLLKLLYKGRRLI